jgi:DNA ligase-1
MPNIRRMLLADIVETSRAVTETRSRSKKIELCAACLARLSADDVALGVAFLSGELRQGKIGVGFGILRALATGPDAHGPVLTIRDVDAEFDALAQETGRGSAARRNERLQTLFSKATRVEREFLERLLVGALRQGALEGILTDAVARATHTDVRAVRRAVMLAGSLRAVAVVARAEGDAGLGRFRVEPLTPLSPMLAETADDLRALFTDGNPVAFETKVDGVRIQAHKKGGDVRLFTRNSNDVTARLPEVVAVVRSLAVTDAVLDGEVIALAEDGRPLPFQTTMSRFGNQRDTERLKRELPLTAVFFDLIHLDGTDFVDRPGSERFAALERVVPALNLVHREVVVSEDAARAFLARVLAEGHEGVMAKALDAPYLAGRRGAGWQKIKPAHTLDLVVIGVEWGSGRRKGLLSNLHLGARDPSNGGFVMLGKTFKGMTDEMLRFQTKRLLELETSRTDYTVLVRPELVVEIAFDGIQESPTYPGGLALRFARVKRYREDKSASEADTIDDVQRIALHRSVRD